MAEIRRRKERSRSVTFNAEGEAQASSPPASSPSSSSVSTFGNTNKGDASESPQRRRGGAGGTGSTGSTGTDNGSGPSTTTMQRRRHRRAKSESDSYNAAAEVERLRWATGIADILPAEPPQSARHSIPMVEMPAHALRDSMLHSGSGFNNYRGLYNLAIIALVSRDERFMGRKKQGVYDGGGRGETAGVERFFVFSLSTLFLFSALFFSATALSPLPSLARGSS
jgi:hypothetical protein